jgi:hypothetical protein
MQEEGGRVGSQPETPSALVDWYATRLVLLDTKKKDRHPDPPPPTRAYCWLLIES